MVRHKQLHTRYGAHTPAPAHMHIHAHILMRDFLTFLPASQENIDESPFKNNSRLVGSLNDLQLFHPHVIITFIMLDRLGLGHCSAG